LWNDLRLSPYALVTVVVITVIVVVVLIAIPVAVPVALPIPMVIVLKTAMIPIPIPYKKLSTVMSRRNPTGTHIRRPSPVTLVPFIMSSHRIPIAFDPHEFRARGRWKNANHARRRRRPDIDPN
jgi:hypothetical protein